MRSILIIFGIVLAALGGVIAYHTMYLAPRAAVVVTDTSAREVPNVWRIAGGILMLFVGALIAFFAARRRA